MAADAEERRQRAWALLDRAYGLDADRREAFLREEAADDEPLLAGLLRALDHAVDSEAAKSTWESGADGDVPSLVGAVLQDRYEVVEPRGAGGMGAVFRGRHVELDQPVAIKVLPEGRHVDEVIHEGRRLAQVEHGSVVRVLDVGMHGDAPYLVMEWLDGFDLAEWLASPEARAMSSDPRPLDERFGEFVASRGTDGIDTRSYWRFVASAMRDVARAIQAAHGQSVAHQDVAPKNIVIAADGRVTLVDFGLSALLYGAALDERALDRRGGTRPYMSPEHRRAKSSARLELNDVYGIGATLLHLVTGRSPDRVKLPARRVRETLHFGEGRDGAVPLDLVRIAWKATQAEPENRYPDARSLADDLDAFLEYRSVSVGSLSLTKTVGLWWRRNPSKASATLLAPVATCAALLLGEAKWSEVAAAQRDQRDAEFFEGYASLPVFYGLNAKPALSAEYSFKESVATLTKLGELVELRPDVEMLRVRRSMVAARHGLQGVIESDFRALRRQQRTSAVLGPLYERLRDEDPAVRHRLLAPNEIPSDQCAFDLALKALLYDAYRVDPATIVEFAEAALGERPTDFVTRELFASNLVEVGADYLALREFDRIQSQLAGHVTCAIDYGRSLLEPAAHRKTQFLAAALERNPDQYVVERNLLEDAIAEGRAAEIVEDTVRLVQTRRDTPTPYELRARTLRHAGLYLEATTFVVDTHRHWAQLSGSENKPAKLETMLWSQVICHALDAFYRVRTNVPIDAVEHRALDAAVDYYVGLATTSDKCAECVAAVRDGVDGRVSVAITGRAMQKLLEEILSEKDGVDWDTAAYMAAAAYMCAGADGTREDQITLSMYVATARENPMLARWVDAYAEQNLTSDSDARTD